VRLVEVETPRFLVIEDLDELEKADVAGAFVVVSPRVPSGARDTFDGAGIKDSLLRRGAAAARVSPVFVAEAKRPEAKLVADATTARAAVEAWFGAQRGDSEIVAAAKDLVLEAMQAEGL
jgi:hypothetical protein